MNNSSPASTMRAGIAALGETLLACVLVLSSVASGDRDMLPGPPAGSVAVEPEWSDGSLPLPARMLPRAAPDQAAIEPANPIPSATQSPRPGPSETPPRGGDPIDEIDRYLWSVYRRAEAKFDSHGDFTWKDVAAAARAGLSVEDYVIMGMDPDFRELLFHAGHAMDAAGINWMILSAFRDDYRQSLASGYKAQDSNSFHGGTVATGGYGHGCAVDLAATDGDLFNDAVWTWLDRNGGRFGLHRPLGRIDPAHVQPLGPWHEIAAVLRRARTEPAQPDEAGSAPADKPSSAAITLDQANCVRSHPPDSPVLSKLLTRAPKSARSASAAEKKPAGRNRRAGVGALIHSIIHQEARPKHVTHLDGSRHGGRWRGRGHVAALAPAATSLPRHQVCCGPHETHGIRTG